MDGIKINVFFVILLKLWREIYNYINNLNVFLYIRFEYGFDIFWCIIMKVVRLFGIFLILEIVYF